MTFRFNLSEISRWRTELMGLSALGIIACHAAANGLVLPTPFAQLAAMGQLGVIIFFFLSGMGVFYSLQKFNGSVWKWYRRRFLRIGIPYSLLSIPFFIFAQIRNGGNFVDFILSYTTIGFWMSHKQVVWFVALLLPMYLISPLIYHLSFFRLKSPGIRLGLFLGIIGCSILITFPYPQFAGAFYQGIFYFVGLWIAPFIKSGKEINGPMMCLLSVALFLLLAFVPGLSDIPRLWTFLPISLIVSCWGLEIVNRLHIPFLLPFLTFMGAISLESYLTNIFLGVCLSDYNSFWQSLPHGFYLKYFFISVLGIALAWICHVLSKKIQQFIPAYKAK